MDEDTDLIRRYTQHGSEESFAVLVRRHVDLVYSTALRRTNGQRQLAEDATQQVFISLAREARALERHSTLAGWLYVTTRHVAGNIARSEHSRKVREQEVHTMQTSGTSGSEIDWDKLRPELDELMEKLAEPERDAVVLRFLQGRRFSEIGSVFRISEDAARMRVERALEKLRRLMERQGVRSTSAALATALTTHASIAAPAGLAVSATAAALASSTPAVAVGGGGGLTALFSLMNTAKVVTTLIVVAGISTIGVGVYRANAGKVPRTADGPSNEPRENPDVTLLKKAIGADKTTGAPAPTVPVYRYVNSAEPVIREAPDVQPVRSAHSTALDSAKEQLARISNLARNGRIQDDQGIDAAAVSAFRAWMREDPQAVFKWLGSVPIERNQRMHTIEAVIAIELASDPEIAFLVANFLSKEFSRIGRLRDVVAVWAPLDPTAVAKAVQSADVSEQDRALLLKVIERHAQPTR